jgi:hypothetical protein
MSGFLCRICGDCSRRAYPTMKKDVLKNNLGDEKFFNEFGKGC